PVVSNLSGYSADLINHSNVGFSKAKATTVDIIKMIKEIKDNPDLEKEMRSNARQLTEDLIIWENNSVYLNVFLKDIQTRRMSMNDLYGFLSYISFKLNMPTFARGFFKKSLSMEIGKKEPGISLYLRSSNHAPVLEIIERSNVNNQYQAYLK